MPLLPRDVGGQGGGIEEAPLDGKLYGRQMAKWEPVPKLLTLIYYRGPFATPDELRAAHPTDVSGAYAVVSSTSSIWIWNHDQWEDTGATQTQAGILDAPHDGKTYGRKDGDWVEAGVGTVNEEQVTNIIKNTPHNDLKSIQGGKVEDGKVTEAYHLTKEEWEKLPIRPFVLSPTNGESNINQVPQIVGSPYAHPHDTLMYMKHIQISKAVDFSVLAYEKEEVSRSVTFQVPLKPDNSPYLEENTLYYARIRYRDRRMRWSHWSAPVKFTTMQTFPQNAIAIPEMIIPADGGEASAFDPLLAMSTPKVVGGVGEFDKADWQISTDSTFATTLYEAQGTDDLMTHIAQGLNLSVVQASDFYARGRQRMTDGQYSPWARPVRFGLRPEFDEPIFGMRRIFPSKGLKPIVYNIDESGQYVIIPKRYWDKHPLYLFKRQDIVVGTVENGNSNELISQMVYIPPCWVKSRVYDNDNGDLVIDMWFSALPKNGDGWMLHPAFTRAQEGFLYGSFFCSETWVRPSPNTSTIPALISSSTGNGFIYLNPLYHRLRDNLNGLNSLDTGNASGKWQYETIYERKLLLDLATAELLTTNPLQFSWRGIQLLSNNLSGFYGAVYDTTGGRYTEMQLLTPNMSGELKILSLDLPAQANQIARGILRGHDDSLGFDLALLGIVNAVEVGAGGPIFTVNALDMRVPSVNGQAYSQFITLSHSNGAGLFCIAPGGGTRTDLSIHITVPL